jgi:hypothetical protein
MINPVSKQLIGKHASRIIGILLERCFLLGPCKVVINKAILALAVVKPTTVQVTKLPL